MVRVLDNLSNGYIENIQEFFYHPRFEFIEGDIREYETCLRACEGINKISHQAALGSVPRSIENPMQSAEVNIIGTVNLMYAAVQQEVERIILAFSSSTYGDHTSLPKVEEVIGNPLSPYAVTKACIEQFADVFGKTYGMNWIGLRYFNVFGPKQDPNSNYSAVIPLFIKSIINNRDIQVNGDGTTSRDFTHVNNVSLVNDLALFTQDKNALNTTYNVGCGNRITLNQIIGNLEELAGYQPNVVYKDFRKGDVLHSEASIDKAIEKLGYSPIVHFADGLLQTFEWYRSKE